MKIQLRIYLTNNDLYKIIQEKFTMIHGPCAIESFEQMNIIVKKLKDISPFFRGGIYKPRTSPESFQGLQEKGFQIVGQIKYLYNDFYITSEITSIEQIDEYDNIDIIQIGARNMQNYELLKAVGKLDKIILLKRGFGNTLTELLNSAKYISNEGNKKIILCERGIRTFSDSSRFTLDLSAINYLKKRTEYPIFVDPSHAGGEAGEVLSLTDAALAYGCDGIIIEVHPNPSEALSDAKQQIELNRYINYIKEKDITKK